MKRYAVPIRLFVLFTAVGLLFFTSGYFDDLARQNYGTAPRRLTEELVGAYTALLLVPFVIWVARRFRITRETWLVTVPITIAAAIVYSLVHTTFNAFGREVVSLATGQGHYSYGIMFYRYPMEAAKDIIYFMVGIGTVDVLDRIAQARRTELAAADLEAKLAQTQLDNLKLQLHPHFLFNTLNAISSVMYEDVAKADEMLSKLSEFLRTVLESSGVHEVPLEEELHVERMYVDIMTTRLERNLRLGVHVDDAARDAVVPFMLLQPLLENSIRHGMQGDRLSLDLAIDVQRRNGSTVISVTDDGNGIAVDAARGIGLKNIESRLSHMYGAAATFSIGPRADGGTRATIVFPFATAGGV
jgi:two-component sensor histidine kinase